MYTLVLQYTTIPYQSFPKLNLLSDYLCTIKLYKDYIRIKLYYEHKFLISLQEFQTLCLLISIYNYAHMYTHSYTYKQKHINEVISFRLRSQ